MIPFYKTFEFNTNISSIIYYHYDMKNVDDRISFKKYLQSVYPECDIDAKHITNSPLNISLEEFEKHLVIWKLQQ